MALTYEDIISDLKRRIFKPVYFLAGEEPYYIDQITDYIEEHILQEAEKAFNQIIVYGDDTNISAIVDTAPPYTVATIIPSWKAATIDPDSVMRL